MEFWWIPKRTTDLFDESLHITHSCNIILGEARGHSSFKKNSAALSHARPPGNWVAPKSYGYCRHCSQLAKLDAHHIFPLWVLSLTFLIGKIRAVDQQETPSQLLNEAAHGVVNDLPVLRSKVFPRWNSRENLILLCRLCHARAELKAFHFFKEHLQKQHAPSLHWSYQSASDTYQTQMQGKA